MGNPQAVGAVPPLPGYVQTPGPDGAMDYLKSIDEHLKALHDRLAPDTAFIPIQLNAVPAGIAVGVVNIPTSGFNAILNNLSLGTVNIYFGGSPGSIPDIQITGSGNPVFIPLPPRSEHQVYIQVDAASVDPATGVIYIVQY